MKKALFALALFLPTLAAAEPARTSPEFQANEVTRGMQRNPDVAVGPDGTSFVVWTTDVEQTSPPPAVQDFADVRGRFFDALGSPLTEEFEVHTAPGGDQASPRAAADGQGNYLAVWRENRELFARGFRADGRPWSTEVRLSASASELAVPSVAGDPRGGFIVAWIEAGNAIRVSRLAGRGALLGLETEVRAATLPLGLRDPEVAAAPEGGFAVTWSETTSTSSGIFVRLYDQEVEALSAPVLVNSNPVVPPKFEGEAVPVFHPDGSFSVVWMSEISFGISRILARRFDGAGRPGTTLPLIPPSRLSYDTALDVASDSAGNLLLVWPEERDFSVEVFGRTFDAAWKPLDETFRVNTFTGDYQVEGAVAAGAPGRFVAVWGSGEEYPSILPTGAEGFGSQDGHFFGVFGQALSTRCLSTTALCLAGGRFKVEVHWTLPSSEGTGQPVPMTDDTGAFWFFGPENLELLVKVLDGRPVNGHFWVFFGGLSDVRFIVTVTDTETGEMRSYPHTAGTLASQADTSAFAVPGGAGPVVLARELLIRPDRLGGEIQANALSAGTHRFPAVAAVPDGSFFVAWMGPGSPPSDAAIFVRAFDPSGAPRTGDIQVTPAGVAVYSPPRIAALPSGRFLVTWREQDSFNGRLFDSQGNPVSGKLVISHDPSFGVPSVAALVNGGFVAVWHDAGQHLRAQRLDANGAFVGAMIEVTPSPASLSQAEVAAAPDGGFAVAWVEFQQLNRTVRFRRFGANGLPLRATTTAGADGDKAFPLFEPGGRLSILWTDEWKHSGTFVRTDDTTGALVGPAILLPSPSRVLFGPPAVATDATGTTLITWQKENAAGTDSEMFGRFFDSSWRPLGGPFRTSSSSQNEPAVAAAGRGRFVAFWSSNVAGTSPPPLSPHAYILGQRFDAGCLFSGFLCLGDGRFRVEVAWKIPGGASGEGRPVPLTDDTGTFWFFGEGNHELMVKILDGRPVNGHFWVFYGALSDVEYTITVFDTVSGQRRIYRNPPGTLASRADTEAFPSL